MFLPVPGLCLGLKYVSGSWGGCTINHIKIINRFLFEGNVTLTSSAPANDPLTQTSLCFLLKNRLFLNPKKAAEPKGFQPKLLGFLGWPFLRVGSCLPQISVPQLTSKMPHV